VDADNRVAVYIDFDNIVISRYNQLHGRGAFQSDRVRTVDAADPHADAAVVERLREATVDIGAILDYASSFGQIVVSCAYADWSQPVNAGYRRQLVDRAVDLTQMFPLSATKNGADIRLAIDVVEDLFRLTDVTHVVLAAGDSDYVALAQRVKRLGRLFVAVGVAGATSKSLPAACNDFSLYDDLPGIGADDAEGEGDVEDAGAPTEPATTAAATATASAGARGGRAGKKQGTGTSTAAPEGGAGKAGEAVESAPVASAPAASTEAGAASELAGGGGSDEQASRMSPRAATRLLRRALELGDAQGGDDGWLNPSAVKQQIKRLDPSFHEKTLGYSSFSDFMRSRSNIAEFDKASNSQKVRLRRPAS